MKALVVYDSVFGNTEKIASAIGNTIGADVIKVINISEDSLKGVELLLVGSPTRGFRPTPAIMSWIKVIPVGRLKGIKFAVFDTRTSLEEVSSKFLKKMMNVFGYASKPIADALSQKGGVMICEPMGFYVTASEGPLKDGEVRHADEWATNLKGSSK